MNISFVYTKARPPAFAQRAFEGKALGGSEASAIHYAETFAKLGHTVSIHTTGGPEAKKNGVSWHDASAGLYRRGQDVVIAIRFPEALAGAIAPVRALYCCDPAIPELPRYATLGFVNLVITISQHQKDRFQAQHPIPEQLYFVSNAGVKLSDYNRTDVKKVPGRCIYCSVPDRGLKYLVQIWPMVVKELPWATLHVTGGFELWGLDVPLSSQPALEELLKMESVSEMGVSYLGVVPREELIQEQLESQVMLLPGNENSPEMCCISAMECSAAGNVLVVGDIAALPERTNGITTGRVISQLGKDWREAFAIAAVELLTLSDTERQNNQNCAIIEVAKYDYSILAPQWLEQFERVMGENR